MIKPCPFCGAPGDIDTYLFPGDKQPTLARAGCSAACGQSMWEAAEDESDEAVKKAVAAAVARWNRRSE